MRIAIATLAVLLATPLAAQTAAPTAQDSVRANIGIARSDLRNLVTAQEAYFADHGRYAPSFDALKSLYQPSRGSTMEFTIVRSDGWAAKLTREPISGSCIIYINVPASDQPKTARDGRAAEEGVPTCDTQPELESPAAAPKIVRPPQR